MEAKETKFYKIFSEIGREFKKNLSCVSECHKNKKKKRESFQYIKNESNNHLQ